MGEFENKFKNLDNFVNKLFHKYEEEKNNNIKKIDEHIKLYSEQFNAKLLTLEGSFKEISIK